MKFSKKVGNVPVNKLFNFGVAIHVTVWIQGLCSGFVTVGRYVKWYQLTVLHDTAVQGMHQ